MTTCRPMLSGCAPSGSTVARVRPGRVRPRRRPKESAGISVFRVWPNWSRPTARNCTGKSPNPSGALFRDECHDLTNELVGHRVGKGAKIVDDAEERPLAADDILTIPFGEPPWWLGMKGIARVWPIVDD